MTPRSIASRRPSEVILYLLAIDSMASPFSITCSLYCALPIFRTACNLLFVSDRPPIVFAGLIGSGGFCQSVAGRGLVSGSRRNDVPKGGWSEAQLWQCPPTTTCHYNMKETDPYGGVGTRYMLSGSSVTGDGLFPIFPDLSDFSALAAARASSFAFLRT